MANLVLKGRDKILNHFSNLRYPLFRLTLASDSRQIISQNFEEPDMRKSLPMLEDILNNIEPSNIYTLETWKPDPKKSYIRPDALISFTLNDAVINGNEKTPPVEAAPLIYDKLGLSREMNLINENASYRSEIGILKFQLTTAEKEINELKAIISDLEAEIEEEEEEGEAVGNANSMEGILANFIKEHGGTIVESITGNKGEKLKDEIKLSGVNDRPELPSIEKLCELLQKEDENLQYHLYILVKIAQQKPHTFKQLLKTLENF